MRAYELEPNQQAQMNEDFGCTEMPMEVGVMHAKDQYPQNGTRMKVADDKQCPKAKQVTDMQTMRGAKARLAGQINERCQNEYQ